jgi:thymidylate synthase (FAD)
MAGRTAYLSFDKVSENSEKDFIKMIIKRNHFSVLEHAIASFRIKGVSRSLTHQLVRHRLCSFTQKSQRYINEHFFKYITPDSIKKNQEAMEIFSEHMSKTREIYSKLRELGIKNEDARFVLPNATESEIVITTNFREWRHIIELRGNLHAQWEIRRMIIKITEKLKEYAPNVFFDFKIDKINECIEKGNIPL